MFSAKDFDAHKCDMPIKDVKRIPVVYFQDDSYNDKKLMTGWGVDGVLYTFEVTPRKPIPIVICPSDESYNDKESDDKLTEPVTQSL
jgi:UDP-galactopyranose mutase